MRIKLTTNVHGAWSARIGDQVERPDPEAQRLIDGGHAIALDPPAKLETATLPEKLETTNKAS